MNTTDIKDMNDEGIQNQLNIIESAIVYNHESGSSLVQDLGRRRQALLDELAEREEKKRERKQRDEVAQLRGTIAYVKKQIFPVRERLNRLFREGKGDCELVKDYIRFINDRKRALRDLASELAQLSNAVGNAGTTA